MISDMNATSINGQRVPLGNADSQGIEVTQLGGRRICFVSQNAYPLLGQSKVPLIGGAEVQQSIIAKCLQENDFDVSFVTAIQDGIRKDEVLNEIEVYKTFCEDDGIPLLRFFTPRLSRLWQALKRADADVYYQRCADKVTGICAKFCRRYDRKFVFSGAHENDFEPNVDLRIHERMMYQWGLRRADAILTQSQKQQSLLKQTYGIDGHVLSNVYPTRSLTRDEGYVLWVGNMRHFKRPLMCLEIARRFPEIKFVMIGGIGSGDPKLYEQVKAQQPSNLGFLGFQPLQQCERYFDAASLLLSTSTTEGFPNTFLQAWSRGIPTLSTFDPDDQIKKHNLGLAFSNPNEIVDKIGNLMNLAMDERMRIQRFFEDRFTPQRYVDQLSDVLHRVYHSGDSNVVSEGDHD